MSRFTEKNSNIYVEVTTAQSPKNERYICGDLLVVERTIDSTLVLLCDGIGSGPKAHLAARLCSSRLIENLRLGISLREACKSIIETMHAARYDNIPFSAFIIAYILYDGQTTILSYEMPPPLIVENSQAFLPEIRFYPFAGEEMGELLYKIDSTKSILLMSDGVTQAGIGCGYKQGWTSKGVRDFASHFLIQNDLINDLPQKILNNALSISKDALGDDTTAVLITCRPGSTLCIMTGPPRDNKMDTEIIKDFLSMDGDKIICGSSTAEMFSRETLIPVKMEHLPLSPFDPPSYSIKGIDLVTEGCITLNQTLNLLHESHLDQSDDSSVTNLVNYLNKADRIFILVGQASNESQSSSQIFKKIGLTPRLKVIENLVTQLKKMGKLAHIKYY